MLEIRSVSGFASAMIFIMSVFAHQVGGDPFHIHELFVMLAAIGGFGFSVGVMVKVRVRDWFKRLILGNPDTEGVAKDEESESSRR